MKQIFYNIFVILTINILFSDYFTTIDTTDILTVYYV